MPLPTGWPPRAPSGHRSIRFYQTGVGTADFADNAYLFSGQAAANTYVPFPVVTPGSNAPVHLGPTPHGTGPAVDSSAAPGSQDITAMIWAESIRICNDGGGDLEYSFDGVNVHGKILMNEFFVYRERREAGIAVRGAGQPFRIEAW